MRLRRLNLIRYGMFDNFALDFGQSNQDASDFHIVFGPNEAGKTTLFNGLLDCFFGVLARSPYAFRHGSAVSVGAVLEIDSLEKEFVRLKKRKDSLLDEAGNPIEEELLSAALGRLSREAWTTMFSLNEETLADGAEDMIAAKGELGPVIFQSAAGLADFTRTLNGIMQSSEEFFVPTRRKTELRDLANQVGEIEAGIKEIDTNERVYKELRDNLELARSLETEARSRHERLNANRNQLEKLKIALPEVEELKDCRRKAKELEKYPETPPGAIAEAESLFARHEKAVSRKRDTLERLERLERESDRIETDPGILHFLERVRELAQPAAVTRRMGEELLRREEARKKIRGNLQSSLVCLGKGRDDDPRQYVLDDARIAELGELTERFSSLQLQLDSAKAEVEKAEKALRKSDDNSCNQYTVNPMAETLEDIANEIRAEDLTAEQKTASVNLENARVNVDEAVSNLRPWNQNAAEILLHAPPTDNQAERWRDRAKRLAQEWSVLNDQRRNIAREIKIAQAKFDNLTLIEGLITDGQANSLRHARDQAWQTHYNQLDRKSADAFKAAMVEDDRARELRSERSDRIAELRSIQMQLKEKESLRETNDREEENHREEVDKIVFETASILASLGLPAEFDPLDLPEWLKKRKLAEKSIAEFQKRERELNQISSGVNAQRAKLLAALALAGIAEVDENASLQKLHIVAVDTARKAKIARVRLEENEKRQSEARENFAERQSAVESIERSLGKWKKSWIQACENSWLRDAKPDSVKALLNEFRILRENINKLDDLDHRLSGMKQEIDCFVQQVSRLAKDLGRSSAGDPFDLFDEINERVEIALNARRQFEQNRVDRERESNEIRRADDELSEISKRVSELAQIFSDTERMASASELLCALRNCEVRTAIHREIRRCEHRLINLLGTATANEAVDLVEGKMGTLETDILACESETESASDEYTKRVRESSDAQNRIDAIGSDEKAAMLMQDRQTMLVEIKEKTKKALKARLGVFVARRALQKYREAHRNELLECASNYFSRISLGNYSKLDADRSADKETLIAKRDRDNRSCQVSELSKGTQFQLYLSLRLAGYMRFCKGRSPLPFVADDVMESFDDERALETFRIMREISKSSQIIYLTHHEHMLEIAERACGSHVRQHHLPVSQRN